MKVDFNSWKQFIAPRYWFSFLGMLLILLGLTGGAEVFGIDMTIDDQVMKYIAILLGVAALVGGLGIHRRFLKRNGDTNK
jgi:uncharacterized membrane protein